MSKILMMNMGAHGHVNPTLALTQELVARGHDVTYAVTPDWEDAIRATGAKFKGYDSLWAKQTPPTRETMKEMMTQFPVRLMKECLHTMPQLHDWIGAERFDVLAYDSMCMAGRLLAEANGVRPVSLHASYVSNEHFHLGKEFPHAAPPPEVLEEFNALMATAVAAYGIRPVETKDLFGHAEPLNLVFLPRAFQKAGSTFDDRYVFTGPNIAPRPTAGTWTPPTGPRQPRLFISLGTVFSNWPEFFNMCFEAFGNTPWQVLMATSTRVDAAALAAAPANFTVRTHFPQLELLPHMDVFLTHGGMNSTMEALYYGIPMVVIPQMPEQAVTAGRVAELGLGRSMTQDTTTVASLVGNVDAVTCDAKIKENVLAMQKDVRGAGGFKAGADAIERYLGCGSSHQERPRRDERPQLDA
jgi:MGT family glycosyltransferase